MMVVVPGVFFTFKFIGGSMKTQAIQKMMQNAKLGKYTEEQMSAIKLVIAFGREEYALSEYEKIAKETQDVCKKTGAQYLKYSQAPSPF